ncbi:MAG: peptidase domain-containing ABC transporter [Rubrivivax sp.]
MQSEAAECGLACVVMIANHHGHDIDLVSARQMCQPTLRGASVKQLASMAGSFHFKVRTLRVELDALGNLALPVILHWNFNHYVVLEACSPTHAVILDPARGRVRVTRQDLSDSFTGIAQELTRTPEFQQIQARVRVPLSTLFGNWSNLARAAASILPVVILLEICGLTLPLLFRLLIDTAGSNVRMWQLLAAGVLLVCSGVFLQILRGGLVSRVTAQLFAPQSSVLFRHLLGLPYRYFETRHPPDIISRFGSLTAAHRLLTVRSLDAAIDGVFCLAMVAILAITSPVAAIAVFLAIAAATALQLAWSRPLFALSANTLRLEANHNTELVECVRGIQTVKVSNLQAPRTNRFRVALSEYLNSRSREQFATATSTALQRGLFSLALLAVVVSSAWTEGASTVTPGALLLIVAYSSQALFRGERVVAAFEDFRMLAVHVERLNDIVLTPLEHSCAPVDVVAPPDIAEDQLVEIELRDVWFRYSAHDSWLLKGINLRIEPGRSTALVGPSGCGKTTLLKIVLGLLTPERGEVLINGAPLPTFGRDRLRSLTASVMQDDRLFSGSIAENIASFTWPIDMAAVQRVAGAALIDRDIAAMPMAYHTLTTGSGQGFSGGQRQRLLIARALYRRPRMLVMDEATSHLDAEREQIVSQSVSELGITRIIVAHRQETIRTADIVIDLRTCQRAEPHAD